MKPRLLAVLTALIVFASSLAVVSVTPTRAGAQTPTPNCHPAYYGACVPAGVKDVNCPELDVAVRLHDRRVDPYKLDSAGVGDGIGCEGNGSIPAVQTPPAPVAKKAARPVGQVFKIAKLGKTNFVQVTGWALDPDLKQASRVRVLVDGKARKTVRAGGKLAQARKNFPSHGKRHRFAAKVKIGKGTHKVCVVAVNEGAPAKNRRLRCKTFKI